MTKRLLLVEDDPALARAVTRLLRRRGFEVYLAGSSAEARAADGAFSLGVFDIDLPDGDGVSLAEELAKKTRVRRVVFYSGTVDPSVRKRAERVGPFVDKMKGFQLLERAIELALRAAEVQVAGGTPVRSAGSTTPPPSGIRSPPGRRRS